MIIEITSSQLLTVILSRRRQQTQQRLPSLVSNPQQEAPDNSRSLLPFDDNHPIIPTNPSNYTRLYTKTSSNMSTQCDTIQAPYDHIRTLSIALIEHANVHSAISPYIRPRTRLRLHLLHLLLLLPPPMGGPLRPRRRHLPRHARPSPPSNASSHQPHRRDLPPHRLLKTRLLSGRPVRYRLRRLAT